MSEIKFTLRSSNLLPGALAALAAAALLCPSAAWSQERGRLLSVETGGDAAASSVELVGDRPLSFTTLKLREPPRVVVDFAETELAGAAGEVEVGDGTVRRVAIAAAGQKTARVVIELMAEAEFDVRAHGNRVEVRIPRIAPLLAKAEPPGATPPSGSEPPAPAPPVAPQDQVVPPAAAAPGAPAGLPAESETEKRASLPTVALVGSGGKAAPPAAGEGSAEEPTAAAKQAAPERPLTAAEKSAAEDRAKVEKAATAIQAARERRLAVAEKVAADQRAKTEKVAAARRAAQDRKQAAAEKLAADQRAAQEKSAARRAAAEKAAAEKRVAATARTDAADKPAVRSLSAVRPQRKLATAGSRHSITGIGFRPSGGGEVIVRSDHPLEYGVSVDGAAVVLHLPGASIPLANNRHPLDTRFFNGPVQRVVPLAVEGGTDLRIELQGRADYQLAQSGSVLTVTFSAPR